MSRIGVVEDPNPWSRSEQPISPMRDRATVLEAMGGRKNAAPFFVAITIILLILIAGAVMLGIGISKAVASRSDDCDSTTINLPGVSTKSSNLLYEEASDVTATPFFLTVTNSKVTGKELNETFGPAVKKFWKQIVDVLPAGDPVVDIISIGPSTSTSEMAVFLGDDATSTLALVCISYTSDAGITTNKIKQALRSDVSLSVDQISAGGIPPSDKSTQLCKSVNPENQDIDYLPCKKRIVFGIDVSADINNVMFAAQRRLLINYTFAGDFNHLDRLGLAFFFNRVYGKKFDDLTDSQGLSYVRSYINDQKPRKGSHSLSNLFEELVNSYDIGGGYNEASYIIFISKLDPAEISSLLPFANKLKSRGGNLALILLGRNADPLQEQAKKLTDNIILWADPAKTETPDNWQYNLWTTGYGCDGGDVPPTVSIPPPPQTLPTNAPTTTPEPSRPAPCDGIFVLGIDTSKGMSDQAFNNQIKFVGDTLFTPDYFNHYERLSLGYYRKKQAEVESLGFFRNEKDISEYVHTIDKSELGDGLLRLFFTAVIDQNFEKQSGGSPVTIIAFVSSLDEGHANDTRDVVKPLKAKGISISLVGLGGVSESLMTIVTGDATRVFQWDAVTRPEPNDYRNWFKDAVKCPNSNPAQNIIDFEDQQSAAEKQSIEKTENSKNPYPCLNGTIIVAYDISLALNSADFDTQVRFLVNRIFVEQFNHLERLTLIDYSNYVDSNTFSTQQSVNDVLEILLDSEQDGKPDLRRLFQTINTWRIQPAPDPVHTIVFVSQIDQTIVNNVIGYVQSLQNKNYDITFVSMGSLNLTLFKQLSENVIPWNIGKDDEPSNWKNKFEAAFGCPNPLPPPTIIPVGPYPCLGNIILAFDSSSSLSENNYQRQISFLLNNVFNDQWSNLNRLALINYNNFASTQSYSTFETVSDVQDFISSSYHSENRPSLYHAIQSIEINNLASKTAPSHALIFISKISQEIVDNVKNFVTDLQKKKCTLTFVALGKRVKEELLKQLSNRVIQWDIDSVREPANWKTLFWTAYGCDASF